MPPRRKRKSALDTSATGSPPTSAKKARVDIDYQQLAAEIIRQQQANAAMHMHDSTATEIASDSQSSQASRTQVANATIPHSDQSHESETSAVSEQGTSSTVSDLINKVFEGEPAGTANNVKQSSECIQITDGIPLGASISVKIKSKIWSNEYIDIRCLLSHQEEDPVTLLVSPGIINLQHTSKSKTPLSINQWTDAFLVFTCITIQKKPELAPHLLKYMSFVREMHKLHGDSAWRSYDESFRR